MNKNTIPTVTAHYARDGSTTQSNEIGMRPMQHRAYQQRGEQYILIKSPPASGKSRALMFIALDKMHTQGVKKTIVAVPEKTIGASFDTMELTKYGFHWDFIVNPKYNLCNAPGNENGGKVKSVQDFLDGDDTILICTHATFRFAVDAYGVDAFDDCLIAIDEFHHVSAEDNNRLGNHLRDIIARDKTHIIAMTGSYFRGDSIPVLLPEDEQKFTTVSYTYYEQLNGYTYLKSLHIGYYFYTGRYLDDIMKVLNPNEKTIIHIPNVNATESTQNKYAEIENIMGQLGEWQDTDSETGFDIVKTADGTILRVANLVDDTPNKRDKVAHALKNSAQKNNRDWVDIIIALGMAKEGFDWIWCEHALTVGYRSSLTEIIQIIGRTTRDAKDKESVRFTNLIAEPDASENMVNEAVNDTLKAISASLLMEQVLAPKFHFKAKKNTNTATEGLDYGDGGYNPNTTNVGVNPQNGVIEVEIDGLQEPKSPEAKRICENDLQDLIIAPLYQNTKVAEQAVFNEEYIPEQITLLDVAKIVKKKCPNLDKHDQEAIRQHAVATMNIMHHAKNVLHDTQDDITGYPELDPDITKQQQDAEKRLNTSIIDGVRQFAMDVRNIKIDMIEKINPFGEARAILSKAMDEKTLRQIAEIIAQKKITIDEDEARELAERALMFQKDRGRPPKINAQDPWEKRMAEGVQALLKYVKQEKAKHG